MGDGLSTRVAGWVMVVIMRWQLWSLMQVVGHGCGVVVHQEKLVCYIEGAISI